METQETELKVKEDALRQQLEDVTNQLKELARRKRQIHNEIRVAKGTWFFFSNLKIGSIWIWPFA